MEKGMIVETPRGLGIIVDDDYQDKNSFQSDEGPTFLVQLIDDGEVLFYRDELSLHKEN